MDLLGRKRPIKTGPVIVIFGDDEFLHRQAQLVLRDWVIGPELADLNYVAYDGDEVALRDVLDILAMPPLLGERRLVVIDHADEFVSRNRSSLEAYVSAAFDFSVLLLHVSTFPSTTRLFKAVDASGFIINAAAPKGFQVPGWCVRWAQANYGKTLAKSTSEWLVELVGTNLGQLDQELFKLATYVGAATTIDRADVDRVVAGTRTEATFKLLDLALDGQSAKALELLDRLLLSGESPVGILALFTHQLRRLTRAARLTAAGRSIHDALEAADVPAYFFEKSNHQLRRLGRKRLTDMFRRLLSADLQLKGGSGLAPRIVLERLLLDLARS
jgi:DNA polymerase-3 subunit delta